MAPVGGDLCRAAVGSLEYQSAVDARRERPGWWSARRDGAAEVMRVVARDLGGSYERDAASGRHRAVVPVGGWLAVVEHVTPGLPSRAGTLTRVRVAFAGRPGVRVTARRARVADVVGDWLGVFDLEAGEPAFDRAFALGGSSPGVVRDLFADGGVRDRLAAQPEVRLEVVGVAGRRAVTVSLHGCVTDTGRLRRAAGLAAATAGRLVAIGVAESPSG